MLFLLLLFSATADADVWKWVDANGKTHYVDSMKSIYTWRDKTGRVFYSDKKDHESAVLVQLVWHSKGTLSDVLAAETEPEIDPVKAHHCKRAKEIYASYLNAPKLYVNNDQGEKEFLSKADAERTIAETKVKMEELCG